MRLGTSRLELTRGGKTNPAIPLKFIPPPPPADGMDDDMSIALGPPSGMPTANRGRLGTLDTLPALTRSNAQQASPAPDASPDKRSLDVGMIPPDQRWQAMKDAAREQTPAPQGNNITMDGPATRMGGPGRMSSPSSSAADASVHQPVIDHLGHINDIADKLDALERQPVTERNGRLKSFLKMALIGGLQGLSGGGGLAAGLGGALAGGVVGGIMPKLDEQLQRHAQIAKTRGDLDHAMKIEQSRASIAKILAEAAKARDDASGGTEAKQRAALVKELKSRMGLTGNKLNTRVDPRQAELATQLNLTLSSGGAKFNPQGLRTIRGADGVDRLVYASMEGGELNARVIDVDGNMGGKLSERDQKMLAIELARENRQRGEDGQGPLAFTDAPPASASTTSPMVYAPTPSSRLGAAPSPATSPAPSSAAPAPARLGRLSTLAPTGEKPEPVVRQGYRGRLGGYRHGGYSRSYGGGYSRSYGGGSSSGGDAKSDAIAFGQLSGVMRDFEGYKDAASRAAARGDVAGANDFYQRARALADMASKSPNFANKVEVGESGGAPYMKLRAAPAASQPGQAQRTRGAQSKASDPLGLFNR